MPRQFPLAGPGNHRCRGGDRGQIIGLATPAQGPAQAWHLQPEGACARAGGSLALRRSRVSVAGGRRRGPRATALRQSSSDSDTISVTPVPGAGHGDRAVTVTGYRRRRWRRRRGQGRPGPVGGRRQWSEKMP